MEQTCTTAVELVLMQSVLKVLSSQSGLTIGVTSNRYNCIPLIVELRVGKETRFWWSDWKGGWVAGKISAEQQVAMQAGRQLLGRVHWGCMMAGLTMTPAGLIQ